MQPTNLLQVIKQEIEELEAQADKGMLTLDKAEIALHSFLCRIECVLGSERNA